MLTKSRLVQLLFMLCLLIVLFVWRTFNVQPHSQVAAIDNPALKLDPNTCDFSLPCSFNSPWGNFYLSIEEGKITPEEWFNVTLESERQDWHVSNAKIVGKNMFMGKIPINFSPVANVAGIRKTQAKTMIGSCTEAAMLWQFDIEIDIKGQIVHLFYDFMIYH